jgi:hypothetical protein
VLLDDLPVTSGTNAIRAVITDTGGRRIEVFLPFYATTERLAEGMSDFSFEAGFPREDFGVASNHYGPAFTSGSVSYGRERPAHLARLPDRTDGYRGLGAGATVGLGDLAEFDGAVLYSRRGSRSGWGFYTGLSRTTQLLTLSASYIRSQEDYFDLASVFEYTRYLERLTGTASLYLGRAGNVNASYIYQRDAAGRETSIRHRRLGRRLRQQAADSPRRVGVYRHPERGLGRGRHAVHPARAAGRPVRPAELDQRRPHRAAAIAGAGVRRPARMAARGSRRTRGPLRGRRASRLGRRPG